MFLAKFTEKSKVKSNLEKAKSYIGFAEKSKNIVCGQDNILLNKNIKLIIISKSLAESSTKKLETFATKQKIQLLYLNDEELQFIYSKTGVKAFGILEPNLAGAVIKIFANN